MEVAVEVEDDNAAEDEAQLEEVEDDDDEVVDEGVNISLVSVCEATKEAH